MGIEERDRLARLRDDLDRRDDNEPEGSAAMLLQTFTESTYPTVAGSAYACHPVSIDVDETEGATPTLTPDTGTTIYAVNIGSEIPDSGTNVIGRVCGGRWVFDWSIAP